MSGHSPTPTPPRLNACVVLFALSLTAALAFGSAFKVAPNYKSEDGMCGETAPLQSTATPSHKSHAGISAKPAYYSGGIWSRTHGQAAALDTAILSASAGKLIVCQSALAVGEDLVIIDRTPIRYGTGSQLPQDVQPLLVLSIDHGGAVSSNEYPAAGALQQYITAEQDNYSNILIVEPLPGPKPDQEEDWTYLNRDGLEKIAFLTPTRNASPAEVVQEISNSIFIALRSKAISQSPDIAALLDRLIGNDRAEAADARLLLSMMSPYKVIPAMDAWLAASGDGDRALHVFESLMIRRTLGVHADDLLAEASESDEVALRALAARAIGDLADVTTGPLSLLTPLAEDSEQAVRYEALVATRATPGRRAAGVAQLVEPYEMSDAMRRLYLGTMAQMLAFGEPVAADSKFSRTLRMPIGEALALERDLIVCNALLQRSDLPDDKIDEVLGQLAEINGQDPLVVLLNLLETMNPSTLAKREALLKKLVAWNAEELNAQMPRLKQIAVGNGPDNLRRAAAAAMMTSDDVKAVLEALNVSPVVYEALAWVTDPAVLKRWAEPTFRVIGSAGNMPSATVVAAIGAVQFLPADSMTADNGTMLFGLAKQAEAIDIRFAAIRAVLALPDAVKPDEADELSLASLDIAAIPSAMKYDIEKLTVTAGQPVELTLTNPDTMEHNLVITLPGRGQEIGVAMSAPGIDAAAIGYVPKDNDAVLYYTKMVPAGGSDTLRFIAPTKPGSYDYVCTFPGHYTSMIGVLEVVAP